MYILYIPVLILQQMENTRTNKTLTTFTNTIRLRSAALPFLHFPSNHVIGMSVHFKDIPQVQYYSVR